MKNILPGAIVTEVTIDKSSLMLIPRLPWMLLISQIPYIHLKLVKQETLIEL